MAELPRAMLIDLDDTLLDDSSSVDDCWRDSVSWCAGRLDGVASQDVIAEIRRQSSWYWSDPERHRSGRLDLRATTRGIVERAFAGLGLDDVSLAGEVAERYRDLREERAELFPGALEALESLRERGVRLGMMTNGAADAQRRKVERYGLAPYFDHIIIEGEFGTGKPDRQVFETLLRELATDPAEAWAVGDNLEYDVLAPMRLGIHGIWIDGCSQGLGDRLERPDRIVAAFTEVAS